MRYLLDTNIVSKLHDRAAEGHAEIHKKIASLEDQDEVAISILTLCELEYGLANAPDDRKAVVRQKVEAVRNDFEVLPVSAQSARVFGELKKSLREYRSLTKEGIQRYNVDLLLAATSLVDGWTLVSTDAVYDDLKNIEPTLEVENWLRPPEDGKARSAQSLGGYPQ